MESAYYAKKIPQYKEDLANGTRTLANTYEIRKALCEIVEEYDCKFVIAHNARFDYNALNNTQRWTTKSKYRYFLPRGLEWWDTLKIARSVMGEMPTYRKFCEENGYLTKNGRLRFTAEICYRFITKDNTFKESHTGLEDVKIESEILAYCHRQHKAMKKKLWGN
jgi:DNA polymerase III epsilon subunit-like protein